VPKLQQAGLGRWRRRFHTDPQPLGRPPHHHRVTDRVGRGELQQPLALRRQRAEPAAEAVFDPPRQHPRAGPEPTRQLRRRQPSRQLRQGRRVAAGLGDDPVAHSRVQRRGQRRIQQRPGIALSQPGDHQLRQPRQLVTGNTGREHQAHRFGRQAAGGKRQDLRGGPVEPLLVVHQPDQRPLWGSARCRRRGS
jgi:hypothetical protein